LVRRVDGQVLQLTPLLYAVLDAIDGRRDFDAVAETASAAAGRQLHGEDVRTLVDSQLRPLGLVCLADGSDPEMRKSNPLLALRPRIVLSRPEVTRRVTAPFAWLFNPVLVVVSTIAFAVLTYWVLFRKGLGSAAYNAFHQPGMLLAVFAITIVSAGFHEFGHAAALRRGGGTPGAMGAGLYLIYPAFYTDVTDSYRLSRSARLRTDLGGLYFNTLVAIAMYALWLVTGWDGLLLVIAAQILQMIRQLPPLVRFDGYHILADITGVPDLFHRIGPTLRSFLPRRWRRENSRELKFWARAVVTLWVIVVVPILLVTALLAVIALPRILATTWHSMSIQAHEFSRHANAGDWAGVGVKALAIVALFVPVGGLLFMLIRVVRRYAASTWKRTEGKPGKRAVAVVAMLAILSGLAYAWWPGQGNYRPIRPYERGTLFDAMPASFVPGDANATVHVGRQTSASTIWPDDGTPLPTADHPALSVVLTPRGGQGATWVFPFNRPDAPGVGDNQSLAVVTRDGGTVYDVSFALVWVTDGTVVNDNEAYAFASCTACRAVAVSFQVVLIVGHANIAAPENIAAAVAYNCIRCVTHALALQLVVDLPDQLSTDATTKLQLLWAQIAAFGDHLEQLSFAEIQATLEDYEHQILAVVQPEVATPDVTTSPSTSPGTETATSAQPSAAASAANPQATATPSPRASAESSGTPPSEPSATPSAQPTATSSAVP
jgi:putative peptide zinc metalloprotease protein